MATSIGKEIPSGVSNFTDTEKDNINNERILFMPYSIVYIGLYI